MHSLICLLWVFNIFAAPRISCNRHANCERNLNNNELIPEKARWPNSMVDSDADLKRREAEARDDEDADVRNDRHQLSFAIPHERCATLSLGIQNPRR